jgi:hypothetical protein
MASKGKSVNMGGLDLYVNRIITGVAKASKGNLAVADTIDAGHIASRRNTVSITTDATKTLTIDESGSLFLLNKADGIVITLPALSAANVGLWYEFQVNTSVTSNAYKISTGTQGTDFFAGQVLTVDTDTAASPVAHAGNGSTHDNMSMAGTTTGGLIGTKIRVTAISSTLWHVEGINMASGAVASLFATS